MNLFPTSTFTHTQTTILETTTGKSAPPTTESVPVEDQSRRALRKDSYTAALSLLHDPSALITLNPLVTHHEEVESSTIPLRDGDRLACLPNQDPDSSISAQDRDLSQRERIRRRLYLIKDSKSLLRGWYTAAFEYYASFVNVDNGCDTAVAAPTGVNVRATWRLLRDTTHDGAADEKPLLLVENVAVTCPSPFAPFIKATLGSSHREMHDRYMERWKTTLSGVQDSLYASPGD